MARLIVLFFPVYVALGLQQISESENAFLDDTCGIVPIHLDEHVRSKRIWRGKEVDAEHLPWAAALSRDGKVFCGATLISSRHLITAGHCFAPGNRPDQITVHLGGVCVGYDGVHCWESDMAEFEVRDFYRNPEHRDAKQTGKDFGIVELRYPVKFSRRIMPICLPGVDTPVPSDLLAYGFGKRNMVLYNTERQPVEDPRIQRLFMAKVDKANCRGLKIARFSNTFDGTFCIRSGRGGPSMGDSGSGVMGRIGPLNRAVLFGNTAVAFMADGHIVDNRAYLHRICGLTGVCYSLSDVTTQSGPMVSSYLWTFGQASLVSLMLFTVILFSCAKSKPQRLPSSMSCSKKSHRQPHPRPGTGTSTESRTRRKSRKIRTPITITTPTIREREIFEEDTRMDLSSQEEKAKVEHTQILSLMRMSDESTNVTTDEPSTRMQTERYILAKNKDHPANRPRVFKCRTEGTQEDTLCVQQTQMSRNISMSPPTTPSKECIVGISCSTPPDERTHSIRQKEKPTKTTQPSVSECALETPPSDEDC